MKLKKRALFHSLIALLLCFSMLVGSTFAWFTDGVASGINMIAAGTLDVELYHSNAVASGEPVDANTSLFLDLQGRPILWEPGAVSYENLRVTNAGDLALAYQLAIATDNENFVVETSGAQYGLSQILKVGVVRGGITAADRQGVVDSVADADWTTLENFVHNGSLLPEGAGTSEELWGVVIYWEPGEFDNYWNLNNGKTLSSGDVLSIDLGISLIATQEVHEVDAFGADYDSTAAVDVFPVFVPAGSATTTVVPDADNKVASDMVMTAGQISAAIPAGVKLAEGTTALTMSITEMDATNGNITVNAYTEASRSLDVHIEGIGSDNTVPMEISIPQTAPKGLNLGNLTLYHVENDVPVEMTLVAQDAAFTAHNQFKYNPATGDIVLYMATFSEVAVVADKEAAWEGEVDHSWYVGKSSPYTIANADQLWSFSQIVGGMAEGIEQDSFYGKTVNLIVDINLNDVEEKNVAEKIFYPIGYNSSDGKYEKTGVAVTTGFYTFAGIFDGQGHSISNFYHNTWEMKGDHSWYSPEEQYYCDGMGLFGRVYGGTVKNLTVKNFSSDGEIATTGVIAAYADGATFENISIFNCNPRVYNIGNGGIVGCVGWYAKEANLKTTFKNITVDNSNKISALWGSYDVACGGIVGQYYPTSGQSSAGTPENAGIHLENCHVSAIMDVYNDVCANYQYYAYRYAGMMIGSIRENTTNEDGKTIPNMTGISASGCTVNYGDWNDYYYCEFEKNGHPSYSGPDDYKFSRVPHSELNFDDSNGNGLVDKDERDSVDGCKHTHTAKENHQAVYLPFHQLFTGYGWGVNSVGLKEYSGITVKEFNLGIEEGKQEESVEKFETKFTGKFLYRVGNANTISVGSLFTAKEGAKITDSGVVVAVDVLDKDSNVSGTFTPNTSDWTKGTIKFSGTGLAKVTIQDYNFCTPTVLYLEVVNATNYASASISSLGSGNVVLLCNTKLNNNGALALQNASLYGNDFEIDVTAGRTTGESITANYLLYLNNGILDNVRIKGAVYTNFDVISSNSWNNPTVLAVGNSKIVNCQISNCASPVRVRSGNLEIVNSTLKGGFFANLDIRGGHIILDNVTTINQVNLNDKSSDGKEIAGLGIVFFYEGPSAETELEIRGSLIQHNLIREDYNANSYANMLVKEIFNNSSYSSLWHTGTDGKRWANTGILSLTSDVGADNIITKAQTNKDSYTGMKVNYTLPSGFGEGSSNGYLYTAEPSAPADGYEYDSNANYEVIPIVELDHTVNAKVKEGDSGSCTYDSLTNTESITFANGESFEWNTKILTCTNKQIEYTVYMDGTQVDDTITFDATGTHTITFKYTDPDNYRRNENGELEKYPKEYEISMIVEVTEQAPTAKSAEITFPLLESYGTTTVTVDGKTYIMPNLGGKNIPKYGDDLTFDASTRKYGSLKADGRANVDIYYPIIKTAISGNYMVFPVFGNKNGTLVQIQDYADQGAGDPLTPYNASTQTLPAGLTVSRGYTVQWSTDKEVVGSGSMSYGSWTSGLLAFKYQSSSDDIACKVMSNYLSYYPNINLRSNDRNEQVMVAEYKYVDNKGDTYYYCVGYHIEERNSGYAFGEKVPESCVTVGTLMTMADGTQKPVEDLKVGDMLQVFNHITGELEAAPLIFNTHSGDAYNYYDVLNLQFSNGTEVEIVESHGFFDITLMEYVYIDYENYTDFIGHQFYSSSGVVTLNKAFIEEEHTAIYCPVTYFHMNSFANGMLNTPNIPGDITGLVNYFEYDPDLKYNEEAMQRDIEKYGLYTYADFSDYISEAAYNSSPAVHLKVAVGKGMITFEQIIDIINYLLAGSLID